MKKSEFNPDFVIELILKKYPERLDLIEKLKKCRSGYWISPAYIKFFNQKNVDIIECVDLCLAGTPTVILDLVSDGRIYGIEFWENFDQLDSTRVSYKQKNRNPESR